MLQQLKKHLNKNFPFLKEKKLLVAVSGGMDSIVLAHLLHSLNYKMSVAHCNFKLRNTDSDLDENFVRQFSSNLKVPFYSTNFDTQTYCKTQKVSIQIGARELRYNWFDKLCKKHSYDYILTGHHLNDVMETFFINLSRGTGIDGLTGISPINKHIIRPLLLFSKKEIENYIITHHISWREDSSNAETKYLRNKIRHHIIPNLFDLNEEFEKNFKKTIRNLHQSKLFINQKIKTLKKSIFKPQQEQIIIDKKELKLLSSYEIYELFKPFGFNYIEEILKILKAQTGKEIYTENYNLLNNRTHLILYPKNQNSNILYQMKNVNDTTHLPINLSFSKKKQEINNHTICIDLAQNPFPLTLRKRKTGDIFSPIGMVGRKKVSKYLKDLKLSKIEKENVWLLCNQQQQIIWIVGFRADKKNVIQKFEKNSVYIILK